jgi:hypothetical protein
LQAHPYPTIRVGGLWFIWIGLVMVLASLITVGQLFGGPLFFTGFAVGVAGILLNRPLRRRLSYGEPTKRQRTGMWIGIGMMTLLLLVLANGFGSLDPRTFWLLTLMIVGLHFFPFALLHGPRAVLLGVLCVLTAGAGLFWTSLPFALFGVADGVLKILVGIWMVSTRPAANA